MSEPLGTLRSSYEVSASDVQLLGSKGDNEPAKETEESENGEISF